MGNHGAVFTSLDGSSWSPVTLPPELSSVTNIDSITYTGLNWIALGRENSDNIAIVTQDGVTLTRYDTPDVSEVDYAASGNGITVGAGQLGFIVSTDEGQTWTQVSYTNGSYFIPPLAFGNGVFVAAQTISHNAGPIFIQTSTDGMTWNDATTINGVTNIYNLVYANARFYLIGVDTDTNRAVWYSADNGGSWTKAVIDAYVGGNFFTGLAYGAGKYIIIPTSQGTPCFTSSDGINFTAAGNMPNAGGAAWTRVIFSHGIFVAVSNQGIFVTSPGTIASTTDGTTWTGVDPENGLLSSSLTDVSALP